MGRWARSSVSVVAVVGVAALGSLFLASLVGAQGAHAYSAPAGPMSPRVLRLSSKCKNARNRFSAWQDSESLADDAFASAADQFTTIDPNLGPGSALTAALNQYGALAQSAQQQLATADADLSAATKAIRGCRQSSLPRACKDEFGTYQPLIDNAAASARVYADLTQAANDANQAQHGGNDDAFNAAVDRFNTFNDQRNQLVDDFNNNLRPAYDSANERCTNAA